MLYKSLMSPWVAALLLQAILLCVLGAKKMWRRFPIFFAYSLIAFAFDLWMYAAYHLTAHHNDVYKNAYWLNEGAGLVLGLAVVYEMFRHLFAPYPALRKLARHGFEGAIAILLILGTIVAYVEAGDIRATFLVAEQAARILEIGLLMFLFLFAGAFGLHWRQYVFGIAVGLGVFVAVELIGVTMWVQFMQWGRVFTGIFNLVRSIAFNVSLLIWIGYILAPELALQPGEMPKTAQLEQWNRAVMELIYQ
jgi:hypothetical protein